MYTCVCEFTRMMYDHQLFTCTHRAIAVAAVATLCSVVCCSHTCSCYCSCFCPSCCAVATIAVAVNAPGLACGGAVVALGLGFLALFIAPILLFTSCPAFLLSSGFCNAVADWGFSDAVASTLVLLLLLLNFLLLPTLTAWHCCSCLCCVSFVAFNASWYC